jgi:8-oxo-dGTP pyrophosphatase MutT (NUDIX family)
VLAADATALAGPCHHGRVWATCDEGHRHWGPQGAAGLLLARDGAALLQLRAAWVHRGGTWSVPGGARERGESATAAALREAHEELGVDAGSLVVEGSHVALCGGWTYETVLARPAGSLADLSVRDRSESDGHRWVPADDVAAMPLHPAFRRAWEDAGSGLESFVRRA